MESRKQGATRLLLEVFRVRADTVATVPHLQIFSDPRALISEQLLKGSNNYICDEKEVIGQPHQVYIFNVCFYDLNLKLLPRWKS